MPVVRLVAALVGLGAASVGVAVLAAHLGGIPAGVLFRDPPAAAKIVRGDGPDTYSGAFYLGAVSTLTVVVWGSIASLGLFVAWLWRDASALVLAGLTALMGADDALMLHERVGPHLGVPDLAWPAVYGAATMVLLWRLVRSRAPGPATALVVGFAFLACSLAVDVVDEALLHLAGGWLIVVEDGSKLLGAMAWVAVPVALHLHRSARSGEAQGPPAPRQGSVGSWSP